MAVKTVKVCNISLRASERDIKEFFSFSGDIEYVDMQSDTEQCQVAYVTFKDSQGAETAILLSGATIIDMPVSVMYDPEYQVPPQLATPEPTAKTSAPDTVLRKAEDAITSMLAKGYVLGKDAVGKAKSFDEKHQLTSSASAKVASFDKKVGLSEKLTAGTAIVNSKVKEVDQKLQVSEKAKSALGVAEQTMSNAGSAIMKNRYVLTGTTWVAGTFSKVAKAASEVGQKTIEKAGKAEDENRQKMVSEFAQVHLSESESESPTKASSEESEHHQPASKPPTTEPQGLVL
ncbi:unnamed protein product [Cuscuta campestris]|uniref:RRM domain-containing protein n=1 Tax=Cuscuta campestris TaxID=132261 RepID=A0A484N160_9ASTE|nr:unnamed protein product [Cuscuta campestris]